MAFVETALNMTLRELMPVLQDRCAIRTTYCGVPTGRVPFDSWVYQEIIWETKPDVIVEVGSWCGGNALMLAHLCDAIGKGRVFTVDIQPERIAQLPRDHKRVTIVEGDAAERFPLVRSLIAPDESVMVIEDSSHIYPQTLGVLEAYGSLIKTGYYMIVEDTNCRHGLDVGPIPGPWDAVTTFLERHPDFESDRSRESFLITWNPRGFLKRTR